MIRENEACIMELALWRITIRKIIPLILLVPILIASPVAAVADVIIMKDGPPRQGIIQEETSTAVKLRIEDALLTIPRDSIQSIGYATPDENQQLQKKWKVEEERLKQEREKNRDEKAKFEAEQMEKGLVSVDGIWVSYAEVEKMKQEEIRKQTEERNSVNELAESAHEHEGPAEATEEKALNKPGEIAQKTEGPGVTTSPKIIIDLPDEVKEIIDVQFKPLETVRKNLTPIERWEAHFFAESDKKVSEAYDVPLTPEQRYWIALDARMSEDTPLSKDTLVFTVTNKTDDMCVDVTFHIEFYNDSDEMLEDTPLTNFYFPPLEPHQSPPLPLWLTNDMKEVRISLDRMVGFQAGN